ncbi:unnamed protein product [Danaus chrysippus]|uniref:(African queen) hypothetical protein n=1 Tax=Danaus chrysippus TaxID=151541 RepID=A0A8J2R8G0_9NEOP|nr:unnamed protein product [Danaus chrysippus]
MAMNSIPYEFLKPLNMAFDLLGRSNIKYFDGKDSGFKKYWRFLYVVPCALTHFIFETLYVISLLTSDSPTSEISWMIPVYLILFQGIIKATVVCIKKTEIETIVEGLGAIWRTDERLTRNQIEKKQYRLKNFNFCLTVLRFIYVYMGTECLMISLCSQMSTDFALLQEDLKCIVVNKNGNKEISQFTTSQTTIEDIVAPETTEFLKNFSAALALMGPIYILCYYAEQLQEEMANTAESLKCLAATIALLFPIYMLCFYAQQLEEEVPKALLSYVTELCKD